jgi:ferredoxin-NADP reductase
MLLRVRSITYLAEAINGYEFVDPHGRDLPRFEAGAHIGLRQEDDRRVRDYSLWNDPAERRHYCIAVLCERDKRGVSQQLHHTLKAGDPVEVSTPRNNFPLDQDAARHVLIAGGIGIAPIMAMIAELRRRRADFMLYYCARSPETTAFREELDLLAAQGRVHFHYDGGDRLRSLDVAGLLREPSHGTHVYHCGPAPLMAAVAQATSRWPSGTVHCEYFTGPSDIDFGEDRPFRIKLAKSGFDLEVPIGATIADVLRRHGVAIRTSCELGYCGACLAPYLGGEPEHRDQILSVKDRERYLVTCCSRAKSAVLELDL